MKNKAAGHTVVEFGLLFPVVMLAFWGVLDVGLLVLKQLALQRLSFSAARHLMYSKQEAAPDLQTELNYFLNRAGFLNVKGAVKVRLLRSWRLPERKTKYIKALEVHLTRPIDSVLLGMLNHSMEIQAYAKRIRVR